jgi:hypothetical protein
MLFSVDTEDLDTWIFAAQRFRQDLPDLADETEQDAAELVAGETRRRVDVLTGAARQSVRVLDYQGDATVVGGSGSVRYYLWLDHGGHAGIRGTTVRRKVNRGRYAYPAYEDSQYDIAELMDDNVQKALRAHGLA